MTDWTADANGVTNSSRAYRDVSDAVADLIWSQGHALIRGQAQAVARLIVSQLAHEHGLAPVQPSVPLAGPSLSEDDIVRIVIESGAASSLDINEEDIRGGHCLLGEVLPAMRLAYELGLKRGEQTPARGGTVEAWVRAAREGVGLAASAAAWSALDDLLDDLREHADTGTPLTEPVTGPHPEEDRWPAKL